MRNLIYFFLCLILLMTGCKKEISSANSISDSPSQISYLEYSPNPDEVILELEFIGDKMTDDLWKSEVKVIRQLKSGFGFKDRLNPGMTVILLSKEKISYNKFYCSAEYQLLENSQNLKTFVLRQYLTK